MVTPAGREIENPEQRNPEQSAPGAWLSNTIFVFGLLFVVLFIDVPTPMDCVCPAGVEGGGMDFLRRLFGGGARRPADDALHLYVRCSHCGAPVHVRINLRNDLLAEYGDDLVEGYRLSKEIMDDRCFRLMRAELVFDCNRRELERTITGGEFITREESEQLTRQEPNTRPD